MSPLRIGFVDHHLNNFHANKFLALLHGPLAGLEVRLACAWESSPTGEDWCAKHGIPRAPSAEAVAAQCDAVVVLAPDNVEDHLPLCRAVFPAGKPVVVDKFLAATRGDAAAILALAREHGVRVFSASALRFAVELELALVELEETPTEAFARGMGEWALYGVHTLSLMLRSLGNDARPTRVLNTGAERSASVTVDFADGRRGWADVRAAANQWEVFPWSFGFRLGDRYVTGAVSDYDGFYANLMREAVDFIRTEESPVSEAEMLGVVAVLEGAAISRSRGGEWVDL